MPALDARFEEYIERQREHFIAQLFRLLAQPSVSATGEGVEECAALLRDIMRESGFEAWLIPNEGSPVVYGSLEVDPSARTVLIYGHYDVQPPEPLDKWESPPFTPTVRHGRVYARGSRDDKGQLITHIFAIEALLRTVGMPRVNVKFLFEGEEESASPSLAPFVEEHLDLLRADLTFLADGTMHESGRVVISFGVRGLLGVEVIARGGNEVVHSGLFGGVVPNPAVILVELLGSMRDEQGNVAIKGFYDEVLLPTDVEKRLMHQIPFDEKAFLERYGLDRVDGSPAYSFHEKIMFRPTLQITGLFSGYIGPGGQTIIPTIAEARMQLRLVANQDPDDIYQKLLDHVRTHAPEVEVRFRRCVPPSKVATDLPISQAIIQGIRRVYDKEPIIVPNIGGTGPRYVFNTILGAPMIGVAYANHDSNGHAPNENIRIDCFMDGIRATAAILEEIARAESLS